MIVRLVGPVCIYGHVIKTRRHNRVIRVERRLKIGTARRLNEALLESEDSETLNTSFIERLNLTSRQGSAYSRRRSTSHARCADQLREHVELFRCHDTFLRPHRAWRLGQETRTPAMQAGLVRKRSQRAPPPRRRRSLLPGGDPSHHLPTEMRAVLDREARTGKFTFQGCASPDVNCVARRDGTDDGTKQVTTFATRSA